MEYTRLGSTGLQVSRICLGAMSFGDPSVGSPPWTLPEDEAAPLIHAALDAGINFIDSANKYSDGDSERILGRVLTGAVPREELVIATKVHGRMRPGPNGAGLSRKAILGEIDASLTRLGTDYVDLYQIHRWDYETPIEETMEALDTVVRAGKARYIGASSMFAWQFAKAQHVAQRNGWTKFVSMQNHLNLLYREEEREMIPQCRDMGVGLIPYSPLARGRLTREPGMQTTRTAGDVFAPRWYEGAEAAVLDAVTSVAARHGRTRAEVALAWVLGVPGVVAPIVGTTRPGHLTDAIAALTLELSDADRAELEAEYRPRPVLGL